MQRRGELSHLLPPLGEQAVALALDERRQFVEIAHDHFSMEFRAIVSRLK